MANIMIQILFLSELEISANNKSEDETVKLKEEVASAEERLQVLRLKLAKRTRAVVTLQRKLDQIPGRAELAQYQRRFLELYNQGNKCNRHRTYQLLKLDQTLSIILLKF